MPLYQENVQLLVEISILRKDTVKLVDLKDLYIM